MYSIGKIEMVAKSRFYRQFKFLLGCQNLKAAFFTAYENVDVDFLAKWIVSFSKDRELSEEAAFDVIDEYIDTGKTLDDLYSDCAEFLNGAGFFGKLPLSEYNSVIEFFGDKMNQFDFNSNVAEALTDGIKEYTQQKVQQRMSQKDE